MSGTFCNLKPAGNGFFVLTMSSADGHQYLTEHAVADLVKTLTRVCDDPNARGLVTTCPAGDAVSFCDGIHYADASQAEAGNLGLPRRGTKADQAGMAEVIRLLMELPMPTVAAVCGNATSLGVALALAHDHLVVWGPAELRLPEAEFRRRLPDYAGTLLREKLPSAELWKLLMSRPCTGDQLVSSCYSVHGANDHKWAVLNDALQLLYKMEVQGREGADFAKARQTMCPETCADVGITSLANASRGITSHERPQRFQRANEKQRMRRMRNTAES